jgi:hypothetical protein
MLCPRIRGLEHPERFWAVGELFNGGVAMAEYTIDIFDWYRALRRRAWLALAVGALAAAAGVVTAVRTAPVYQGQAVLSVPTSPVALTVQHRGEAEKALSTVQLINVSETAELVGALGDAGYRPLLPYLGDRAIAVADLADVRVDDIYGTERYFRIIVKVRDHPGSAVAVLDAMSRYLQQHPVVARQVAAQNALLETALPGTKRQPAVPGVPARVQNYEFIRPPTVGAVPIKPRPLRDIVLMTVVGLAIGSAAAVAAGLGGDARRS